MLKIGSVCSGVGWLDLAVEHHYGAKTVWQVEYEAAPSKVLKQRFPGVPNYGDLTAVDWHTVEPIDILIGGFPCQDVSQAGRQAGLKAGTRTGLFHNIMEAAAILRPKIMVFENVAGLYSADGDVWPQELQELDEAVRASGSDKREVAAFRRRRYELVPRAIATVLGALAEARYDAKWTSIRASDVGAPHHRERVFIVATDASGESIRKHAGKPSTQETGPQGGDGLGDSGGERSDEDGRHVADTNLDGPQTGHKRAERYGAEESGVDRSRTPLSDASGGGCEGRQERDRAPVGPELETQNGDDADRCGGLPADTDSIRCGQGTEQSGPGESEVAPVIGCVAALSADTNSRECDGDEPSQGRLEVGGEATAGTGTGLSSHTGCGDGTARPEKHGRGGEPGEAEESERHRSDAPNPADNGRTGTGPARDRGTGPADSDQRIDFGKYDAAIRRWEDIIGPAPAPTELNQNGNPRLNARFAAWMMGHPDWFDGVEGLTRTDILKCVGNGVVTLQAVAALERVDSWEAENIG